VADDTFLDGWFALKALIAPDLPIVDLPFEGLGQIPPEIPDAWRRAIDAAQQTPEGRARIALAFTLGQWPAWGSRLVQQPDLDSMDELQHSMYHTLSEIAAAPGGNSRIRKELSAQGQQLSWNTDIDYGEFFENGNAFLKTAVQQLYEEADQDLEEDLVRVNEFPRVAASDYALEWWNNPGRTAKGAPQIPLLQLHTIGDPMVPLSLAQGYAELVEANIRDDLYREAYVLSPTHCDFTPAEVMAAIETLERRLDQGSWGSTDPEQMNALAESLDEGAARFLPIDDFAQQRYNRTWAPPNIAATDP
jgi:hypothetical protein